jgi:hypothetical protein
MLAEFPNKGFPTLQDCNALLAANQPTITTWNGLPLRFIEQQFGKLPFEAQYEPRCYLSGEVQLRAHDWHDLFNALVWLAFPKTKAVLNARHYHALVEERASAKTRRGPLRDANTLLDESGVIVAYSDAQLADLLREFKWKELFWQHRRQLGSGCMDRSGAGMQFYLFGHGLYEKTLQPYVGMTGHAWLIKVSQPFFSWPLARQIRDLDGFLAEHLSVAGRCSSTSDLSPVPLLGVPGWAMDNEHAEYYDNTAYFRPGRIAKIPDSKVPDK